MKHFINSINCILLQHYRLFFWGNIDLGKLNILIQDILRFVSSYTKYEIFRNVIFPPKDLLNICKLYITQKRKKPLIYYFCSFIPWWAYKSRFPMSFLLKWGSYFMDRVCFKSIVAVGVFFKMTWRISKNQSSLHTYPWGQNQTRCLITVSDLWSEFLCGIKVLFPM